MSHEIIVNDSPGSVAEAVAEIQRRADSHHDWLVAHMGGNGFAARHPVGCTRAEWERHDSMLSAYLNVLRLLRHSGAYG